MKAIKILLVEDDQDDQEFFILGLESIKEKQFDVKWVKNGVEAMDYLNRSSNLPDFVVLDLNLPIKDGFETLKEIRSSPSLKYLPVNMLTTSWSDSHISRCKMLGCSGYFTKPISLVELEATQKKMVRDWELQFQTH